MQRLKVSAVIPTKNRPADLARAVASLVAQTRPVEELIVIDQSETAESFDRVGPLASGSGIRLIYRRDTSISGSSAARNAALELVNGDVVLFLDDDIVMEPEFVENLVATYQESPEATGVSGIITNYPEPPRPLRLWRSCFIRGVFHDDRQPIYWRSDSLRNENPIRVTRFGGGLMSFRAAAICGLQFEESLHGVCDGEDVDFCAQMRSPLLLLNPRARLAHYHSPSGRLTDHWTRRAIRAHWFLYLKHWNHGLVNRVNAVWLLTGYFLLLVWSSLRGRSVAPVVAFFTGFAEARKAAATWRARGESRAGRLPGPVAVERTEV